MRLPRTLPSWRQASACVHRLLSAYTTPATRTSRRSRLSTRQRCGVPSVSVADAQAPRQCSFMSGLYHCRAWANSERVQRAVITRRWCDIPGHPEPSVRASCCRCAGDEMIAYEGPSACRSVQTALHRRRRCHAEGDVDRRHFTEFPGIPIRGRVVCGESTGRRRPRRQRLPLVRGYRTPRRCGLCHRAGDGNTRGDRRRDRRRHQDGGRAHVGLRGGGGGRARATR
jgi:hypothetical protein